LPADAAPDRLVSVATHLPGALLPRPDRESVIEEAESARRLTPEERAGVLEALCRLAAELVSQHRDPHRALEYQEPLPPDSERLLASLRRRCRQRG
jgi:hypothetical protein